VRMESSVTSISWIPSEAIPGVMRLPFDLGPMHYDDPPGDQLGDVATLARSGAVRFINELRVWIDVEDGRIVAHGHAGRGWMGKTRLGFGSNKLLYPTIGMPDIRPRPEATERSVRFVQTTGGRTGLPAPRRVKHPPFVQFRAPTVWTTLALTIRADGSSSFEVLGASKFPRHWVYDHDGKIAAKVGLANFKEWYRDAFGKHTPWGDQDSKALVTAVETALERQLSVTIMSGGARPEIRTIKEGDYLVHQGDPGDSLFLLLDGVLSVTMDGENVAEVGPGVVLGERAVLEGGIRTASLQASTPVRVAVAPADRIDREALLKLREHHQPKTE